MGKNRELLETVGILGKNRELWGTGGILGVTGNNGKEQRIMGDTWICGTGNYGKEQTTVGKRENYGRHVELWERWRTVG